MDSQGNLRRRASIIQRDVVLEASPVPASSSSGRIPEMSASEFLALDDVEMLQLQDDNAGAEKASTAVASAPPTAAPLPPPPRKGLPPPPLPPGLRKEPVTTTSSSNHDPPASIPGPTPTPPALAPPPKKGLPPPPLPPALRPAEPGPAAAALPGVSPPAPGGAKKGLPPPPSPPALRKVPQVNATELASACHEGNASGTDQGAVPTSPLAPLSPPKKGLPPPPLPPALRNVALRSVQETAPAAGVSVPASPASLTSPPKGLPPPPLPPAVRSPVDPVTVLPPSAPTAITPKKGLPPPPLPPALRNTSATSDESATPVSDLPLPLAPLPAPPATKSVSQPPRTLPDQGALPLPSPPKKGLPPPPLPPGLRKDDAIVVADSDAATTLTTTVGVAARSPSSPKKGLPPPPLPPALRKQSVATEQLRAGSGLDATPSHAQAPATLPPPPKALPPPSLPASLPKMPHLATDVSAEKGDWHPPTSKETEPSKELPALSPGQDGVAAGSTPTPAPLVSSKENAPSSVPPSHEADQPGLEQDGPPTMLPTTKATSYRAMPSVEAQAAFLERQSHRTMSVPPTAKVPPLPRRGNSQSDVTTRLKAQLQRPLQVLVAGSTATCPELLAQKLEFLLSLVRTCEPNSTAASFSTGAPSAQAPRLANEDESGVPTETHAPAAVLDIPFPPLKISSRSTVPKGLELTEAKSAHITVLTLSPAHLRSRQVLHDWAVSLGLDLSKDPSAATEVESTVVKTSASNSKSSHQSKDTLSASSAAGDAPGLDEVLNRNLFESKGKGIFLTLTNTNLLFHADTMEKQQESSSCIRGRQNRSSGLHQERGSMNNPPSLTALDAIDLYLRLVRGCLRSSQIHRNPSPIGSWTDAQLSWTNLIKLPRSILAKEALSTGAEGSGEVGFSCCRRLHLLSDPALSWASLVEGEPRSAPTKLIDYSTSGKGKGADQQHDGPAGRRHEVLLEADEESDCCRNALRLLQRHSPRLTMRKPSPTSEGGEVLFTVEWIGGSGTDPNSQQSTASVTAASPSTFAPAPTLTPVDPIGRHCRSSAGPHRIDFGLLTLVEAVVQDIWRIQLQRIQSFLEKETEKERESATKGEEEQEGEEGNPSAYLRYTFAVQPSTSASTSSPVHPLVPFTAAGSQGRDGRLQLQSTVATVLQEWDWIERASTERYRCRPLEWASLNYQIPPDGKGKPGSEPIKLLNAVVPQTLIPLYCNRRTGKVSFSAPAMGGGSPGPDGMVLASDASATSLTAAAELERIAQYREEQKEKKLVREAELLVAKERELRQMVSAQELQLSTLRNRQQETKLAIPELQKEKALLSERLGYMVPLWEKERSLLETAVQQANAEVDALQSMLDSERRAILELQNAPLEKDQLTREYLEVWKKNKALRVKIAELEESTSVVKAEVASIKEARLLPPRQRREVLECRIAEYHSGFSTLMAGWEQARAAVTDVRLALDEALLQSEPLLQQRNKELDVAVQRQRRERRREDPLLKEALISPTEVESAAPAEGMNNSGNHIGTLAGSCVTLPVPSTEVGALYKATIQPALVRLEQADGRWIKALERLEALIAEPPSPSTTTASNDSPPSPSNSQSLNDVPNLAALMEKERTARRILRQEWLQTQVTHAMFLWRGPTSWNGEANAKSRGEGSEGSSLAATLRRELRQSLQLVALKVRQ
jgi:hypothetical protein